MEYRKKDSRLIIVVLIAIIAILLAGIWSILRTRGGRVPSTIEEKLRLGQK